MGKTKKSARMPPRASKQLPDALREFLDRCIIPSLVEKYCAKKESAR
jgi:hypothetical protein